MKTLIIFGTILFSFYSLEAQTKVYEKQILNSCHLIFNKSDGSGLFYSDTNNLYLITARHVIFDLTSRGIFFKDSILKVITFPRDVSYASPDTIQINLVNADKSLMIKIDPVQDIVVIRIATITKGDNNTKSLTYLPFIEKFGTTPTRINSFTVEHILSISKINLGDDIAVFGFPTSLISDPDNPQFDYNRPLIRKGIIAGLNVNNGTIILDCPVYPGNSGGPVVRTYYDLVDVNDGFAQVVRTGLIGIVIQFIPLVEKWENHAFSITNIEIENSGYSVVVPIEIAMNLIKKF